MAEETSHDDRHPHPLEIWRLYGAGVLLRSWVNRRRSLLSHVARAFPSSRVAMPGCVGRSYRVARLIEQRVAKIYRLLGERFAQLEPVGHLFRDFEAEELDHADLMTVCLYTVRIDPKAAYAPSILDPEIRALLGELRAVQRRIPEMTLEEAFKTAEALEAGEANVVFGKLLKQVAEPEVHLLRQLLHDAEDHAVSVPRRIDEVRHKLSSAELAA